MWIPLMVYINRGSLWITVMLLSLITGSLQIDCYVCSSLAGNDPLCEDPFDPIAVQQTAVAETGVELQPQPLPMVPPGGHLDSNAGLNLQLHNKAAHPNGSFIYLQRGCYGARKSRKTAFPATACLKLAGHFSDTGEKMVVRACALDGGSLTSDTEIVRQNHCGGFFLNDRYVRGCLEACFTDGCNGAPPARAPLSWGILLLAGLLAVARWRAERITLFPV
ncbi:uncharacterized protein LOC129600428 [Paramacrobiotus metropolitanus]|uniref:uncharacterized protein LOC129600428 n=1 Tax=Paramacrobiotus metropolitanus TaxID=2943436 RepID=UPI0024463A21|nr:uncharacterized protein LOC129600428 [Paramacrobiotus metropolitanus]